MPKKQTQKEVIEAFRYIHGDFYDYSKVSYTNNTTKVTIICPIHGEFVQTPKNHKKGSGCSKCGDDRSASSKLLQEHDFIVRSSTIHNNRYDYSKIEYTKGSEKVTIICPIHGEFEQTPADHLSGRGCLQCSGRKRKTKQEFIEDCKKIHGDKYDYSKVQYISNKKKVTIICPIHGEFEQTPKNHKKGSGCPACGRHNQVSSRRYSLDDFQKRAIEVHGDRYHYDESDYQNNYTKIRITCPEHGMFEQTPQNHLQGKGCRLCVHQISNIEREVLDYILSLYEGEVLTNVRDLIPPKEIDIYLPELGLAIEVNGIYWHSEKFRSDKNYHLNKTNELNKLGINLIHIWDVEWTTKKRIVKNRLKVKMGQTDKRYYARKTEVRNVSRKESEDFLRDNHIQGACNSSIRYGLYADGELLAIMTFGKSRFNKGYEYELLRYCSKGDSIVVGGASKLYKYFITQDSPKSIISYADRRWNTGALYKSLGMSLINETKPNYWYHKENDRENLYNRVVFQKHKLKDRLEYYDPGLTEQQNMLNNGYNRIYDCGNFVYSTVL